MEQFQGFERSSSQPHKNTEGERTLMQPEVLQTIIGSIVQPKKDGQSRSAFEMTQELLTAPAGIRESILSSPEVKRAYARSIIRPTETGNPSITAIVENLNDVPTGLRHDVLTSPEVIEAMVIKVCEPEKPTATRLNSVPDEIQNIVAADPRVRKALQS